MNKVLCSLLVIAILGSAQCESFKRVQFDQGRTHIQRNLETVTAPTRAAVEGNTAQAVAAVKLLPSIFAMNDKEAPAKTPMAIFLHSAESGFCSNSAYFEQLDCVSAKDCKKDSHDFGIQAGNVRTLTTRKVLTDYPDLITLENSTAWKLTTGPVIVYNIYFLGANPAEKSAYGFIGLGTQGIARNNFIGTETPTFSLSVNSTGKGSLIFGNDTTLIQTTRKEKFLTWNTTANWIGSSSALYGRYKNNTKYESKVYFDLTQEKARFYSSDYADMFTGLNLTTRNGSWVYNATEKGAFSKHPPFMLTIGGSNVTIPAEALFKVEDPKTPNVYTLMVEGIGSYNNYNTSERTDEKYTIFGTHFLSNFYTVFHAPKGEELPPFVQLHPVYTPFAAPASSSTSGSGGKFLIGLIAVIGLGAVGFIVFRNKAASKLQEHLNEK